MSPPLIYKAYRATQPTTSEISTQRAEQVGTREVKVRFSIYLFDFQIK